MLTGPSQRYRSASVSAELLQQELRERRGTLRRHFEPHGRAELALRQLALQRLRGGS